MPKRISENSLDWPLGKYVCTRCKEQRKASFFVAGGMPPKGSTNVLEWKTVCYLCKAEDEKVALAKVMAERRAANIALRGKAKRANLPKKVSAQALKASAKSRTGEKKARAKLKAELNKDVQKAAAILAREQTPVALAERELASRELARRSLLHYTERSFPDYDSGWVHEDICKHLEDFMYAVEAKKSPRLMLWLPPRHGKSELASIRFVEWVFGHHPEWEFISTSYSVDLPIDFSRRIKARINSDDYKLLFPKTALSKDSQATESWRTADGGGYRAAGVGGGITGMGAHILCIDDPVKDATEADSENVRQKIWDWYGSTAYTRLAPGGGVLIIQTRWHDSDLSGQLESAMVEGFKEVRALQQEVQTLRGTAKTSEEFQQIRDLEKEVDRARSSLETWKIVKYPAIATYDEYLSLELGSIGEFANIAGLTTDSKYKKLRSKGEALHPSRFSVGALNKIKKVMQPRHWSALYQQNPVPDEGMFFSKDMVRYAPSVMDRRNMLCFATWDLAVGQRATSDWTVGIVGGLDWEDNIWVLDMFRGRWNTHQIVSNIIDVHLRYDLQLTGIEQGQLEIAIRPILKKVMEERRAFIALADGANALKPITDKVMRARPLQGRMQQGKVFFPMEQPWVDTAVHELLRFPVGGHDDIVDALSWLVRLISRQQPPPDPNTELRAGKKKVSWRDRVGGVGRRPSKNFMGR